MILSNIVNTIIPMENSYGGTQIFTLYLIRSEVKCKFCKKVYVEDKMSPSNYTTCLQDTDFHITMLIII
jgi:hypothetical protein